MHILYSYLYEHPYLALLQVAFTIWMLVDAYSRHAETFWFWVILFLPLVGGLAYFFCIKVKDFRGFNLAFLQRRESLEELRYRAEHIPTLSNDLALAERLIELGDFAAAIPHLEAAQKKEPDLGQVLYGLALCHCRLGRPGDSLSLLNIVVQRDPRWSGYRAWHLLIEAHEQNMDMPAAIDRCRALVNLAPTLEHKCLLGEYLLDAGQKDEAQRLLQDALRDHQFNPGPIRRRNRRWASTARKLLKRG